MKIVCRCGGQIIDSDHNRKYVWTSRQQHEDFFDKIVEEVQKRKLFTTNQECAYALYQTSPYQTLWQCPHCSRLVTWVEDQPVFFQREPPEPEDD